MEFLIWAYFFFEFDDGILSCRNVDGTKSHLKNMFVAYRVNFLQKMNLNVERDNCIAYGTDKSDDTSY